MTKKECRICGTFPCEALCPENDPYGGDQARENDDYEMGASYDDRNERYYGEGEADHQWGGWDDEPANVEGTCVPEPPRPLPVAISKDDPDYIPF